MKKIFTVFAVFSAAVILLSGCSVNASRKIDFISVSSAAELDGLPLTKHSSREDESWSDEIKKYKVNIKKYPYTKNGQTMDNNVIDEYRRTHPLDVTLTQDGSDGIILVRIWTDGEVKKIAGTFDTMKK